MAGFSVLPGTKRLGFSNPNSAFGFSVFTFSSGTWLIFGLKRDANKLLGFTTYGGASTYFFENREPNKGFGF